MGLQARCENFVNELPGVSLCVVTLDSKTAKASSISSVIRLHPEKAHIFTLREPAAVFLGKLGVE